MSAHLIKAAQKAARANLSCLRANPYPGRGLLVGRATDGAWLQLYWLMGRSAGSRNRMLVASGTALRTAPRHEEAGVGDAALTLYDAMLEAPGRYLVSNGAQTRAMAEALDCGERATDALAHWEREPDAPHHTPRISALLTFDAGEAALTLSILKASATDARQTDRFHYHPASPPPGFGFALTTYAGADDPLPSFCGEPLLLPLSAGELGASSDTPAALAEQYWRALNAENRVALAVKRIPANGDGPGEIFVVPPEGT